LKTTNAPKQQLYSSAHRNKMKKESMVRIK